MDVGDLRCLSGCVFRLVERGRSAAKLVGRLQFGDVHVNVEKVANLLFPRSPLLPYLPQRVHLVAPCDWGMTLETGA